MPVKADIFQTTKEKVPWEFYPPANNLPSGNGTLIIEDITDPDNVLVVTGTYTTTDVVAWDGTNKFYLLPAIGYLPIGRYKIWVLYPNDKRSLIRTLSVVE